MSNKEDTSGIGSTAALHPGVQWLVINPDISELNPFQEIKLSILAGPAKNQTRGLTNWLSISHEFTASFCSKVDLKYLTPRLSNVL